MKDLDSFDAPLGRSGLQPLDRTSDASDDSGTPMILTVCTGNICRSPLAETLLRARMHGIDATVRSAGTHAPAGVEMTGLSQEIAVTHGASPDDVAAHRARWLTETIAAGADLVLAMSREHRTAAVELSPSIVRCTFTVREFASLSAALDEDAIRRTADAAGTVPRARLAAVLTLVAGRRGQTTPTRAQDDDVIDPYRRDRAVYEESASQLIPAVDEVARVLRTALR